MEGNVTSVIIHLQSGERDLHRVPSTGRSTVSHKPHGAVRYLLVVSGTTVVHCEGKSYIYAVVLISLASYIGLTVTRGVLLKLYYTVSH